MQVLARMNTAVVPISDSELTNRQFVETWELPVVKKIGFTFPQSPARGDEAAVHSHQHMGTIWIDLDKPAPADCHVQWWRTRPSNMVGHSHGGVAYNTPPSTVRGVAGWRALGWTPDVWAPAGWPAQPWPQWKPGNSADMPDIAVPEGTTRVQLGLMSRLFRPHRRVNGTGITYSRYYREVNPAQWNTELHPVMVNRGNRNATKAVFKIGVHRRYRDSANLFHLDKGPMSVETLIIQRWRFNQDYGARGGGGGTPYVWALKADVV